MSIFSLFFENQQSQLGFLYLDVLASEQLSLPSEVTKYPVEDGSEDVSDHITCNNEELEIHGTISASTSFGMEFGPLCYSKLIDAIDQLRQMHEDRQPIKIVTGLGQYEDMGFTALTIMRQSSDKGGQWLDITASLRKIKKVALKEAELPPDSPSDSDKTGAKGKTGTSEKKAGKSGTSSDGPTKSLAFSQAEKHAPSLLGPVK